jgi:hypothetical protein
VVALETIHDQAMFAEYAKHVAATLLPFEGRFVARGGKFTVLEGEWQQPRTVIIEFPTRGRPRLVRLGRLPENHHPQAQEFERKSRDSGWCLIKSGPPL